MIDPTLFTKYKPRVEDIINANDIDHDLAVRIYEDACQDDYSLVDYSDGVFIYHISFKYNKHEWMGELKELIPKDIVDRDLFGIHFMWQ